MHFTFIFHGAIIRTTKEQRLQKQEAYKADYVRRMNNMMIYVRDKQKEIWNASEGWNR